MNSTAIRANSTRIAVEIGGVIMRFFGFGKKKSTDDYTDSNYEADFENDEDYEDDDYDDDDEGISVYDAAEIWLSNGKDEDYMFGYSEEELEDAL